jgi:hypothetical protein
MKTSSTQDVLAEVWAIKDSLSASLGHSLKATCRAMYAEQKKHPGDFVNLGAATRQNETQETGQSAAPPVARKRHVRPASMSV